MADEKTNIERLVAAGLVVEAALDLEDRATIAKLTDADVTQLIDLSRRLYPDDPSMMKLRTHSSGQARLFFPL